MSIALTLLLFGVVSLIISGPLSRKIEEMLPVVMLTTVLILYPAYCLDLLKAGTIFVYVLFAGVIVYGAYRLLTRKETLFGMLKACVTPGMLIYLAVCAAVFLITRDQQVVLWDEMRLWGAMPKALFYTEARQLGENALIFPIMQAYPPAMPLLVYFMSSLASIFREHQIFEVYGLFSAALLLPGLKNLKWKQWPLYVPLMSIVLLFPCLFTSHGGDGAYFYNSLFIDAVLGILIGYTALLSARRPFDSMVSLWKFVAALAMLALIKESGAGAAVCLLLNAFLLEFLSNRKNWDKRKLTGYALAIAVPAAALISWNGLIHSFGIVNENMPAVKLTHIPMLKKLWFNLTHLPIATFKISFLGIVLASGALVLTLLLWMLSHRLSRKYRDISPMDNAVTMGVLLVFSASFLLGMGTIYGEDFPSFQRYTETLIFAMAAYLLLRGLELIIKHCRCEGLDLKKVICSAAASLILIAGLKPYLTEWQSQKWLDAKPVHQAQLHAEKLLELMPDTEDKTPAQVYLLIADDHRENSLLHHRIYYNLLGTQVNIKNFYNNMRMVKGDEIFPLSETEKIRQHGEQWPQMLLQEGYDYVYVLSSDPFTEAVFAQMDGRPQASPCSLYQIVESDSGATLIQISHS